jgi:predicted TIM-barrel fold metal-dependent hydrolase
MQLIAIEEHFLTPEVQAAWAALPPEAQDAGQALQSDEMKTQLKDLEDRRIELMDESGVDVQVLSLTTPALHPFESAQSVLLASETNNLIAATVSRHPHRFQGFATLPTPSPQEAAAELQRAVRDLGLKGALLCGRTRDKSLDHPDFWPIFEAAASLRVPLFLHPQIPQQAVRDVYYSGFSSEVDLAFATFGLGWHYEAGIQFLRLILAGVFDRYPELQIILGHWGEVVLFYTERLNALNRVSKLQRPILDYMRQNLYVTCSGMFTQSYLDHAVEIVGFDRILFSTDYPYQYRPGRRARTFLEQAVLTDDQRAAFAHRNWNRLTTSI